MLKDNLNVDDIKIYRPVSNLSFISKLLERIVSEQITSFLESHDLLPARQSAYRSFMRDSDSCETALLRIHSDLVAAADAGNISLVAMLDLSAAFDCVDHEILLKRLSHNFGLDLPITRWMQSYLTGRTQFVKCHTDISSTRAVLCGAPRAQFSARYCSSSTPLSYSRSSRIMVCLLMGTRMTRRRMAAVHHPRLRLCAQICCAA